MLRWRIFQPGYQVLDTMDSLSFAGKAAQFGFIIATMPARGYESPYLSLICPLPQCRLGYAKHATGFTYTD